MATAPNPLAMILRQALAARGGPGAPPGGGLGGLGGPGAPPGGGPGGPPGANLAAVQGMAAEPSPSGEEQAVRQALTQAAFAASRFHMRDPKIARELSTASVHLRKALEMIAVLPSTPVAPPPPNMPVSGTPLGDLSNPGMPPMGV